MHTREVRGLRAVAQQAQMGQFVVSAPSSQRGPAAAASERLPSAPHRVPAQELLTAAFLSRHTHYCDLQALLWAGGAFPEELIALSNAPCRHWDAFIARSSRFPSWQALLNEARGQWLLRRLGLATD